MKATTEADRLRWRLPSFQRKVERARGLIAQALGQCQRPYVAFSGGKDSLVVLRLVAEQCRGVVAIWSDDELEYEEQPGYITGAASALGASLLVTLGWAEHAGWFRPWRSEPYWRRPLAEAVRIDGLVEDWARDVGYDGTFVGLREDESTARRVYLGSRGWLYRSRRGVQCNPLGGWTVDEVWAAIAGMGLPYNPVYDRLAEVGVPREMQRVGPLPLAPQWVLQRGWPEMLRRLEERYGHRW
jgi:3'-phosphoadenosine 5'-phosphosulfate sulfotransferase (PAPS reductase)/FAD synthetase